MARFASILATAACAWACSSEPAADPSVEADAGESDAVATDGAIDAEPDAEPEADLTHDFEPFDIEAGDETEEWCQQWTLGNEEALYVNWVRMKSQGGFHHTNFFFVPESHLPGPDGSFRCAERGYLLQLAALAGGVLYAQSTQADSETQGFAAGAAIAIPKGYKILGNLHMLNSGSKKLTTHIRFEIGTLAEADVTARLTGFSIQYGALDIPPHTRSSFTLDCDFDQIHQQLLKRPIDFSIHRMLPHYHKLGQKLHLELVGGDRDGEVLIDSDTPVGEPAGITPSPPISLVGAKSIRLSCDYDNTGDQAVGWGIGPNEMCVMFGFSDSTYLWAGDTIASTAKVVDTTAGVVNAEAQCTVLGTKSSVQ